METSTPNLIGSGEAARILRVSRRHLSRLRLTPAMRLPGSTGAVLYFRDDVVALAEQRAAE